MPRIARIAVEGVPCHITQRGNARQQIFFDETDYRLYLDLLERYSAAARLRIRAYCMMPNHVHLIGVPERPDSMARALGRTHADFARYFNLRRRSCGHVWQARYYSCPLDARHLWQAMAYIERNPVRARMVREAGEYEWSSAGGRLGRSVARRFLDLSAWEAEYTPERWEQVLASSVEEEAFGQRLAEASLKGRPLGEEDFLARLEREAGRMLRVRKPGRPRNAAGQDGEQLEIGIGN